MLAYAHPIAGVTIVLLLVYVASLGLRARTDRRARRKLLAQHERLATPIYIAVLALWVTGLASAHWLREDLSTGASYHLRIGSLIAAVLTGSYLSARWMQRGQHQWREIHPWLGAAAVLLSAIQLVTGLQLMP